jgi:hypothetical protein
MSMRSRQDRTTGTWLILRTTAMLVILQPVALHAQPQQSGPHVLRREVHDRWVHEGQDPRFVSFHSATLTMHLRGTASGPFAPFRFLRLVEGGQQHSLMLDNRNRIRTADAAQPPVRFSVGGSALDDRQTRWMRLTRPGATLSLPMARLWEVPFPVADLPPGPGVAWSDTLAFDAEADGLRERLEGVWTHRVVGDTVIDGRTLPLVETDADIRYTARELTLDGATESVIEVVRDVSGRMRSRAAVDTTLGVRAAGRDSTALHGTATLHMAGSEPVVSDVSYDRRRYWELQDSAAWVVRQDSLREMQRRQSTGMLGLPRTPLEERLRAGDASAADSLFAAWAAAADPAERRVIESWLRMNVRAEPGAEPVEARLQRMRLAAGDTAGWLAGTLSSMGGRPTWTLELLPWLRDPGRLWRHGILPRFIYQELGNALLAASPLLEPDTSRWRCRTDACDAIIALLDAPVEQRLRDAALAGAFARDPALWYSRVQQRAAEGSVIARQAERLGRGVGANWAAASGAGVPEPGADWRAWLDWMGGQVRFEESHRNALRVYTARTGRDPMQELLQEWTAAQDSGRMVLGIVLRGTGTLGDPAPAELAASLLTGSEADRAAAVRQLGGLLRRHGTPLDPDSAAALLQALLGAVADDARTPWPSLHSDGRAVSRAVGGFHGIRDVPVFVVDENVPPAVAATIPAGLMLISRNAWEARPLREGGVLIELRPARAWGDFVSIGLDWTALHRRAADEAPGGFAGGGELILLRTDDGWVVVTDMSWIT